MNEKAEYETSLYDAALVCKDHPRIVLRGMLDGLHARAVLCATVAQRQGESRVAQGAICIAQAALSLLAAEYSGQAPREVPGLDLEQSRADSHAPRTAFGIEHFFADAQMGETMAHLNVLRTYIRDCERAAIVVRKEVHPALIRMLNRLSSHAYCLMCTLRAEQRRAACK